MIPASRLAAGVRLELDMTTNSTAALGPLCLSSSDGLLREAELRSPSHLRCVIEAAAFEATSKIHSATTPVQVTLNGQDQPDCPCDPARQELTLNTSGKVVIEVFSR